MLRLLLILLAFACKQQPAGDPDPCAQYPGSICPGHHHPAHDEDKNKGGGKKGQTDDGKQTDDGNQTDNGNQTDDGGQTDDSNADNADGVGNADGADNADGVGNANIDALKEVKLSELKVYAYLSREQVAKPAASATEGEKLPSNEQGYVVGFYFSAWSQLDEEVRKQIVSTLAIEYGHFLWDTGNASRISLPVGLVFSAEEKQHCWKAKLGVDAFKKALQESDFISGSKDNRTALHNLQLVQGRMLAMEHSTGDCQ